MKIKALLLLSFFILSSSFTMGQTTKGYIISVEMGKSVIVSVPRLNLTLYVNGLGLCLVF